PPVSSTARAALRPARATAARMTTALRLFMSLVPPWLYAALLLVRLCPIRSRSLAACARESSS
ncbi:MAG TPA: hypothetical protein VJK66_07605, partial [Gaiellaceae bacterium]|nr:hypothetical protein [Gaiellaceae bacterium]